MANNPPVGQPMRGATDEHVDQQRHQHVRTLEQPESSSPPTPPTNPSFSWSSSIMTMFTIIASFAILCSYASRVSTLFALKAAQPMYALYPSLVAAMLVGGMCALICYLPTMLAVFFFQILFGTDIRKGHTPPPGMRGNGTGPSQGAGRLAEMGWSLLRDGASTIKLALLVAPIYVMLVGDAASEVAVESRSLEAAAGGQLAAAIMTLKIMMVGMREIWDLVPLVVFRLDRDART